MRHADRVWIGGEWVGAHSGRTIDLVCPNTEEVIGAVAEADAEDMDAAVAAARAAFDIGPVEPSPATRAHRGPQAHGAAPARAHGRDRARLDAADGRARELCGADDRGLHHGVRADHRRRGEIPVRRDPGIAGREERDRRARARRRGRGDRAVERALRNHAEQGGLCARRRLHGHHEAVAGDAARGLRHRRGGRVRRRAGRRGQPGVRRPRGERSPRLQPGRRQGQLHRLDRRGQAHRQRLRRAHRALHAGARRQVGGDRARRLSDRCGGPAPHRDHHADERAGVRDAEPRDRAAAAA